MTVRNSFLAGPAFRAHRRYHPAPLLIAALLSLSLLAGGCARPYVHPGGDTASTPALAGDQALMDDGFRLPLTTWRPAGDQHAVVLAVHGMNDYSNAFATVGPALAERGITLVAYDQRGFGATEGHGYWHGSERLVEDLRLLCRLLRERYPGRPLYLLGESMGGAAVLAALSDEPPPVDGIILVAPAVWSRDSMPWYQRAALWIGVHTVPGKQLTGEGLDIMPSDNIEMLRALGRDPLVIKATRIDTLYGVSNLMDRAFAASGGLQTDTLLLYGAHDDIIPQGALCRWLEQLPPDEGRRDAVLYPHGYHMLTRDLEGNVVVRDIGDWIIDRGGIATPSGASGQKGELATFCHSLDDRRQRLSAGNVEE